LPDGQDYNNKNYWPSQPWCQIGNAYYDHENDKPRDPHCDVNFVGLKHRDNRESNHG